MRVRKNIFWGLAFILAAIALVVKKLGYLQGVGIWSILFSAILAVVFVKGIIKRRWANILFSAAFFIIVNDELLQLEALTPWTVLGVALLGTIGLGMIFPKGAVGHRNFSHQKHSKNMPPKITQNAVSSDDNLSTEVENIGDESNQQNVSEDGETIQHNVIFGNYVKYVKTHQLSRVNADCIFGDMSIYLTEAALKNHRACISIDIIFGNTDVYVPAEWCVNTNLETIFGDVRFLGTGDPNSVDQLQINGDVIFGTLQIHYV